MKHYINDVLMSETTDNDAANQKFKGGNWITGACNAEYEGGV